MKKWEHFSDEELYNILKTSKTYRETLLALGYSATSRTSIIKEIEKKIGYTMARTNMKISNEDVIGEKYGDLEIISLDMEKSKEKQRAWVLAQCSCGTIISVSLNALKKGNTKSCGCRRRLNVENMIGQKFGEWEVLSYAYTNENNKIYWNCKCSCGKERNVLGDHLKNGTSKSCGCKQGQLAREKLLQDLTGKKFGSLIAIERDDSKQIDNRTFWKCKCKCGNIVYVQTSRLNNGNTSSCGCRRKSYGEEQIETLLKDNHINYFKEFSFNDLYGDSRKLRFDFAIFKDNQLKYLIECQGRQHYYSVDIWGGEEGLLKQQRYDEIKFKYCKEHSIPLIIINFSKSRKIDKNEVIKEDLLVNN